MTYREIKAIEPAIEISISAAESCVRSGMDKIKAYENAKHALIRHVGYEAKKESLACSEAYEATMFELSTRLGI